MRSDPKLSKAGLVFVTTFLDRHTMTKYLGDISWETEVWVRCEDSTVCNFDYSRVDKKPDVRGISLKIMVGARGFEPPASWS